MWRFSKSQIRTAIRRGFTYVQNRAFGAMAACEKWERQRQQAQKKGTGNTLSKKRAQARQATDQAIPLADDISLLGDGLREDILAVVGPDPAPREALFDGIVEKLRAREKRWNCWASSASKSAPEPAARVETFENREPN